jgi:cyclophilin family peptidyl-prolyl cis-trans isomerase
MLCLSLLARGSFAGTLVQFHTSLGDIDVELYDKDKPATVKNFLNYIEYGLYNNSFLHRCPTNPTTRVSDFVVQGGNYYVANFGTTNEIIDVIPTFPPIVDEFASGARYSNVYGTLAMAKLGGNTNSATSSWFFNLTNNAFLDAADANDLFCVFGHVVRGTNVLNQFFGRSLNKGIQNLGVPLDTLPVNFFTNGPVYYSNLYYVSITILSAQVKVQKNGSRQITWNSINGLTNNVEYATNLPPVWHVLTNVIGTGNATNVTDSSTDKTRFYRVHVLY